MAIPNNTDMNSLTQHAEYRSAFEQLLTSLSTNFINLPIESIDGGIVEALGKVGSYTGVDRCFVYQFSDETRQIARLSHEWCKPGIAPIKDRLQSIDLGPLEWVVEQLTLGNIVHVPDAEQLPPEAEGLRTLYALLGVRSAIYVPMFFKHASAGMLGFSCVTHTKVWPEESIHLLRVVGEIVVNAVDRKNDYVQLQVSNERYKSVVEDQTDFISRWKPDGTQTFVNGAFCRFMGMSAEELLQVNVFDIVHPEDVDHLKQRLASLSPDQPITHAENRVVFADGSVAWHQWSDRALFDVDGELVEYQSVGRDITEQKRAQQELEYREKLQRLILNLTLRFINLPPEQLEQEIVEALRQVGEFVEGDRSYIYLLDATRTSVTMAYEWVTEGSPPTPAPLRHLSNLEWDWGMQRLDRGESMRLPDLDSLPPNAEKLRELIASIHIRSLILVPVFAKQQMIGFMGISSRQRGVNWSDDSAALLRLIGEVFANALERQAAVEALRVSEERLRLTIDAVADGFYDWDVPSGRVYGSDNWLMLSQGGIECHEWTVDDWKDRVHPDDLDELQAKFYAHLSGETRVFECEYRVRMRDGSWRWNLDRGRVIERSESGEPLRMVGVDRDVTEAVLSRQRLQEAEAHLAHLARVATMGEIVAGIAHEVNQPLHAAATFATASTTALESNEAGSRERAVRMVGKISDQINRAADIIRRLREFTRPRQVQMARVDVNALVRETAELLAYEAKRKQVRVEFDVDEFLPGAIGDKVQIQQVIVNLLRNAIEAIVPQQGGAPSITVRTQHHAGTVRLQVEDNGTGLPEGKEIEELFDAFTTTKEGGMGMGLALSRSIIARHHGKIWGACNPQGGMTFTFVLPVEPGDKHE